MKPNNNPPVLVFGFTQAILGFIGACMGYVTILLLSENLFHWLYTLLFPLLGSLFSSMLMSIVLIIIGIILTMYMFNKMIKLRVNLGNGAIIGYPEEVKKRLMFFFFVCYFLAITIVGIVELWLVFSLGV